jgi:hypothetical protein
MFAKFGTADFYSNLSTHSNLLDVKTNVRFSANIERNSLNIYIREKNQHFMTTLFFLKCSRYQDHETKESVRATTDTLHVHFLTCLLNSSVSRRLSRDYMGPICIQPISNHHDSEWRLQISNFTEIRPVLPHTTFPLSWGCKWANLDVFWQATGLAWANRGGGQRSSKNVRNRH